MTERIKPRETKVPKKSVTQEIDEIIFKRYSAKMPDQFTTLLLNIDDLLIIVGHDKTEGDYTLYFNGYNYTIDKKGLKSISFFPKNIIVDNDSAIPLPEIKIEINRKDFPNYRSRKKFAQFSRQIIDAFNKSVNTGKYTAPNFEIK